MDPGNYRGIFSDMSTFVREKEFYYKAGKDWKRAYLSYNPAPPPPPPGTSSTDRIMAAMANYLKFDIFHLDLTSLSSISDLANALASTRNRSLITIKDFHHWAAPHFKNNELMYSGLLGIIDELLSSCRDERIIVLTTDPNHGDLVDAALMHRFRKYIYIDTSSPGLIDLPDGGEIVQLDSSEQKTLFDFDATNNGEYQSGVLVSILEKENTREASKKRCMTKSALSLQEYHRRILMLQTTKHIL
ncbi:AAA-ATPase At5g17760-like [Rhododendron vialii]|uniref:AAA-ATPase At5g17760-like n=1 Tax=Rhododendron vialii TaxID=182163 RepID=UPI00265FCFE8|nr:AAA-ATPase At5g17760-like [Rhododendron vialii]